MPYAFHPARDAGLFLVLGLLVAQGVGAADEQGRYGVRGAGLVSCDVYEREREARSSVYHVIGGWIDGYITGSNQHAIATYDVTSFESTEMLAAVISENCKQHPKATVFAVLRSLIDQASQDRLKQSSEKIPVRDGDRTVLLYERLVERVQRRLAAAEFYQGDIDGTFNPATRDALKLFQQSRQLEPTGFPDQVTLWRLLKSDAESTPPKGR